MKRTLETDTNDDFEAKKIKHKIITVQDLVFTKLGHFIFKYLTLDECKALRFYSKLFMKSVGLHMLRTYCIDAYECRDQIHTLARVPSALHCWKNRDLYRVQGYERLIMSNITDPILEWPASLTQITLSTDYDRPLGKLPSSLTYLKTGFLFDQPIDNLPDSVTHLCLGYFFNKPVDKLPSLLTKLEFDKSGIFNQPVDHLPPSLTLLILADSFNQTVDRLPSTVRKLRLGNSFNQHLDHLPVFLVHLEIGHKFDQRVDNLPASLVHLQIGHRFDQPLDHLPEGLAHLDLQYGRFNQTIDHLPSTLKVLYLSTSFDKRVDKLPKSLHILWFGCNFNKSIDSLPDSIIVLKLGRDFNQCWSKLPPRLVCLKFEEKYNQPIEADRVPKTLRNLDLEHNFQEPLSPELIDQLNFIDLHRNYMYVNSLPQYARDKFFRSTAKPKNRKYSIISLDLAALRAKMNKHNP